MPMPTYVNERLVKTGCWTEREDDLLAEWQSKYGNRWCMVAKKIPGRTGQQCAQRWRHKVNPNIKKEKWSPAEDQKLLQLYEEHGGSWAQISRHLEGRTDQQCMGRWKRHLDPTITREAWTDEEDARLHDQFLIYGSQWSSIARSLPGRTAQQCRARWFQVGGGAKNGGKTPAKQRQQRQDESWSDDGTAYQDEYTSDVDLSEEEEEAHCWGEAADDEYESSGEHAVTPRASRGRAVSRTGSSGRRMSQASSFSRTLTRRSACRTTHPHYDSPDSAVGSNAGPSGSANFSGSGNLDDVEEADIEAGQILTALKASPSPIRRVRDRKWGLDPPNSSRKIQIPFSPLRHNSSAASNIGVEEDEGEGAGEQGHLQADALVASAPSQPTLFSPIARRPYKDPKGRTMVAELPAGLSTPQTPRSVSRLAGISPGPGPWPEARSPSVPIMTMLQSPQAPDSDTFLRSPSSFQGLVTPDWSRKLAHPRADPQTAPPTSQGWTPSRLGGGERATARHTVARRLNVDQALKGTGPLGMGLAPLTVPQNVSELEGQGSGAGDAGQDVGSPLKKMRMGSGLAHARDADDAAKSSLQHYIAARQQHSFGNSSEAANTAFSGAASTAHQLQIQPLCLTGSPTASSLGVASTGNATAAQTPPPGTVYHTDRRSFQIPGAIAGAQVMSEAKQMADNAESASISILNNAEQPSQATDPAQIQPDLLAGNQSPASQEVAQLLAGAVAARAKLEPERCLTDKENSACIAFDEMTMGRQETSSLAEAASNLGEVASGTQFDKYIPHQPRRGHENLEANVATPSIGSNGARVSADMERYDSGKFDSDGWQGRSAARRMKLHAMLENL